MQRRNGVMLILASLVLAIAGVVGTLAFTDRGGDDPGQIAQAQGLQEDRGIRVDGEGQISVEPDIAKVVLGVQAEGEDLDALRDETNSRMDDVIQALQDQGIDENDIQTRAYNISVREEEDPPEPRESRAEPDDSVSSEAAEADEAEEEAAVGEDTETSEESETTAEATVEDDSGTGDESGDGESDGDAQEPMEGEGEASDSQSTTDTPSEPRITGYEVRQLVEVTVRDIDATGDVIDTALDAGANNVRGIRFEVEDREGAIEQARELAVENAREKAEHLADLTGVSLGSPLYIDERSPSLPVEQFEEAAMEADDGAAGASAPIQPGESVINVNVNIIYAIE